MILNGVIEALHISCESRVRMRCRRFSSRIPCATKNHRDLKPNCGCRTAWARHLEENGFAVTLVDNPQINRLKATWRAVCVRLPPNRRNRGLCYRRSRSRRYNPSPVARPAEADGSCRAGYTDRLAGNGSRGNAAPNL